MLAVTTPPGTKMADEDIVEYGYKTEYVTHSEMQNQSRNLNHLNEAIAKLAMQSLEETDRDIGSEYFDLLEEPVASFPADDTLRCCRRILKKVFNDHGKSNLLVIDLGDNRGIAVLGKKAKEITAEIKKALQHLNLNKIEVNDIETDFEGVSHSKLTSCKVTKVSPQSERWQAFCELIIHDGTGAIYAVFPAHLVLSIEQSKHLAHTVSDITETRCLMEREDKSKYVFENENHKESVYLEPPPLLAYRHWERIPTTADSIEKEVVECEESKVFMNDIALLKFSSYRRDKLADDTDVFPIPSKRHLDALARRSQRVFVGNIEGRLIPSAESVGSADQHYGLHLSFLITSKDVNGKTIELDSGSSGLLVFFKSRDGQLIPVGMLVAQLSVRISSYDSPIYQAVVLSEALKEIKQVYPSRIGRIQVLETCHQSRASVTKGAASDSQELEPAKPSQLASQMPQKKVGDTEVDQKGKDSEMVAEKLLTAMSKPVPRPFTECREDHVLIFGRINFDVVVGDIAQSQEDAVINSTGEGVNLSVSISAALAEKAGEEYKQVCKELRPLAVGSVQETSAYNMLCKRILHCNCPYWSTCYNPQEMIVIFIKCLEMSAEKGDRSVALPAIGMGNKGYPAEVVASALLEAAARYAEKNPESSIKQVKVYLYKETVTEAQKQVFELALLRLGCKVTTNGLELANGTVLEVFTGDLAETKADVVVNSTGNSMSLRGGAVSSALLKKAGNSLLDECKELAPIRDGDIAVSKGYGLLCDYVIHGCTPRWRGDESGKKLGKLITKCLLAAEGLGAESVAFPALGTGLGGYPPDVVAKSLLQVSAKSSGSLEKIKVVIHTSDQRTKDGFEKALGQKIMPYVETKNPSSTRSSRLGKLIYGLPPTWEKPINRHEEFKVTHGSNEWSNCVTTFTETLTNPKDCEILEITRVQNPTRYNLYSTMRAEVSRKLGKSEYEVEQTLWHGADRQTIPFISRVKFDQAASKYGRGAYFSTTSQLSSMYCKKNSYGEKFIVMARVVTGEYTLGNSGMKSAPYKEFSELEQYDSVVDDVTKPSVYVVFYDASAYPEYIIKFKQTASTTSSQESECSIL